MKSTHIRLSSVAAACGLLLSGAVRAQGPAPGPAPAPASAVTVGFMHAIHATNEVEKTLAFYRDVFGVSGQVRDFANQAVPILTDSPGVTLKVSMLQPARAGLQLRADAVLERRAPPAQPQIWDPGAPHMKFLVRDIEPVVAGREAAPERRS